MPVVSLTDLVSPTHAAGHVVEFYKVAYDRDRTSRVPYQSKVNGKNELLDLFLILVRHSKYLIQKVDPCVFLLSFFLSFTPASNDNHDHISTNICMHASD